MGSLSGMKQGAIASLQVMPLSRITSPQQLNPSPVSPQPTPPQTSQLLSQQIFCVKIPNSQVGSFTGSGVGSGVGSDVGSDVGSGVGPGGVGPKPSTRHGATLSSQESPLATIALPQQLDAP